MPRRPDIRKVLIIGSGPIVIGQACEFDYSGTQACKALRQLGYEIVLVNSNPATIMTDPVMADETYIEPLNLETLTEIIAAARPDALLPNLGGQSGLNLSSELYRSGVLDELRGHHHRRGPRRHRAGRGSPGLQRDHDPPRHRHAPQRDLLLGGRSRCGRGRTRIPGGHPPRVHHGRHRRRPRLQPGRVAGDRGAWHPGQPGGPGAGGGIGARLGGAGARGGPRRQEPDDHRLLHRERRRHGSPHRRQLLHRSHADHRARAAGASCRSTPMPSSRPSR